MIRKAGMEDADALAALAVRMWTAHDPNELAAGFEEANRIVCFRKSLYPETFRALRSREESVMEFSSEEA